MEVPRPGVNVIIALISLYTDTGRLVDANELAKWRVLKNVESSGEAWANGLLWNYSTLGMWDAAEYWSDRSEKAGPEYVMLNQLNRSHILVRQERFADAVEVLRTAIKSGAYISRPVRQSDE